MLTKSPITEMVEIIKEPFKDKENRPKFTKSKDINLRDVIVVDLPRHDNLYHGTTFSLRCNDKCYFHGEIITKREDEEIISDNVEKSNCQVTYIHKHPESIMYMPPGKEYQKESHIHFECYRKAHHDAMKIAKFLREL